MTITPRENLRGVINDWKTPGACRSRTSLIPGKRSFRSTRRSPPEKSATHSLQLAGWRVGPTLAATGHELGGQPSRES